MNDDILAIEDAIYNHSKICKKIGEIDNRIQSCVSMLIVGPFRKDFEIRAEELRGYRTKLEDDKAKSEETIYKAFEHYYS